MLFRITFVAISLCLMNLNLALAQTQTPDIITFPNFVTPQEPESVTHLPLASKTQIQAIEFVTHKPSNQQIQMPTQGSFKVIFTTGKSFKILDQNATDGKAIIQMPIGNYDFYLQAWANKALSNKEVHLKMEDPLYHIYQTIDSNLERPWYKLSGRPMPVPSDWHNPDGNQYALSFSPQSLSQLSIHWLPATQINFPVGIAQIGPEGGKVELPGVASLIIPNGALDKVMTIVLRHQTQVASRKIQCSNPHDPYDCAPGMVFAAPIIQIAPLGTILSKPGQLDLPIYDFFSRYGPRAIQEIASMDVSNPLSWQYYPYLDKKPESQSFENTTEHNLLIWVKQFSYISREMFYTPSVKQFDYQRKIKTAP